MELTELTVRSPLRLTFLPHPCQILLTGASGFLAIHVAQALLADGFEVIGTVRSSDKVSPLCLAFSPTRTRPLPSIHPCPSALTIPPFRRHSALILLSPR